VQSSESQRRRASRRLRLVGDCSPRIGNCPRGLLPCEKQSELEELLSTLAHDMRDPLTVILGYSQLMDRAIKRGGSMAGYAHAPEAIATMARRLNALIQDLVDSAGPASHA
jgi:signal transduction histidine kinase